MAAKKTWIVCGMDGYPLPGPSGNEPQEFASSDKALKRAKQHAMSSEDTEAWVFQLTHVVSRPDVEADVEKIK